MPNDAEARLERLVDEYGALIRRVVSQTLRGRLGVAPEDVEQEVLVALWKRLRSEEPIRHPASYVYQAARREAIRILQREAARCEEREAALDEPPASPADAPDAALATRETRERVERALAEMAPERSRAVRAHLMGFDVQEIMEMYRWPYQKARNLIARGVADLRAALGGVSKPAPSPLSEG